MTKTVAGGEFDWTSDALSRGQIYKFCARAFKTGGYYRPTGEFNIPDLILEDAYISLVVHNREYNEAPEQTADYDIYLGTATPDTTFAAIRSYGTLANDGLSKTISGYSGGPGFRKSFQLDETKITKNAINYLRVKGPDKCNREIDAGLWSISLRSWIQAVYTLADNSELYLDYNGYEYKAA